MYLLISVSLLYWYLCQLTVIESSDLLTIVGLFGILGRPENISFRSYGYGLKKLVMQMCKRANNFKCNIGYQMIMTRRGTAFFVVCDVIDKHNIFFLISYLFTYDTLSKLTLDTIQCTLIKSKSQYYHIVLLP